MTYTLAVEHIEDLENTMIVVPEGVTKIGKKAFAGCKVLKSIQLPSTLTEIDEGAFCNSGLTECRLPKNIKKLNDSRHELTTTMHHLSQLSPKGT